MRFNGSKALLLAFPFALFAALPALAQMQPHFVQQPVSPPSAPPVIAPPVAPPPVIPTAPTMIAPPPSDIVPEKVVEKKEPTQVEILTEKLNKGKTEKASLTQERDAAYNEWQKLQQKFHTLLLSVYGGNESYIGTYGLNGPGSLSEANSMIGHYTRAIESAQSALDYYKGVLQRMVDGGKAPPSQIALIEKDINYYAAAIETSRETLRYWSDEASRRAPVHKELLALQDKIMTKTIGLSDLDKKLNNNSKSNTNLYNELDVATTAEQKAQKEMAAAAAEAKKAAEDAARRERIAAKDGTGSTGEKDTGEKQLVVDPASIKKIAQEAKKQAAFPEGKEILDIAGEGLDPSETMFANTVGLSADTMAFRQPETLQELREYEQQQAFSELSTAEWKHDVVNTVDLTGQGVQMVISYMPGMDVADAGLSALRGFGETLGDEIAKGTSLADAAKLAVAAGGYSGVVSIIGNNLTGGLDKVSNRIMVLSKAGFSKLTTKQVTEMGANGITFMVVKTGQFLTTAVVDSKGRKAIVGALKDNTPSDNRGGAYPSGYGGYGTSVATQPIAHY